MVRTTVEIEKSTLQCLREIGRKSQTYDELIARRIRCNSLDCHEMGSVEVSINNEMMGELSLFVCPKCLGKFQK